METEQNEQIEPLIPGEILRIRFCLFALRLFGGVEIKLRGSILLHHIASNQIKTYKIIFPEEKKQLLPTTWWAATGYKWSKNPSKWPYKMGNWGYNPCKWSHFTLLIRGFLGPPSTRLTKSVGPSPHPGWP